MTGNEGREPYKRLIVFTEVIILVAAHSILFAILWNSQYKESIELPFFRRGNWAMIAIYPILMLALGKVFGIFRLAMARVADLILSFLATLFFVNLLMYFELLLLIRSSYPSIVPLLILFLIECGITAVWFIIVRILNNHVYPPHDMVLIHGDYPADDIVRSMNQRNDRYHIKEKVNINEGMNKVMAAIEEHEAVVISDLPATERNDVVKYCYASGKQLYMLPKLTDIIIRSSEELHVFDSPVLLNKNFGLTFDQRLIKRTMDIVVSFLMIILSSWLMVLIAIAIKLDDGGPVFYISNRVGRFGKEFRFYKFRSMQADAESQIKDLEQLNEQSGHLFKIKDDPRITRVGRFLRRTSLDELPQIFNIFKGDISFVGPRSPLPREVANYTPKAMQRLSIIGGLTCYWQISGRSTIGFDRTDLLLADQRQKHHRL